jgi:hypothetical protein
VLFELCSTFVLPNFPNWLCPSLIGHQGTQDSRFYSQMQVLCFSCRLELRSVRGKSRLKRHKPSLLAEFLFEASTNCSSRMRFSSLNCQRRVAHRADKDFPVSVGLSKHPTKEDSVQRQIDFIKSLCCGYGGNGNGISSFILQMLAIGKLIK